MQATRGLRRDGTVAADRRATANLPAQTVDTACRSAGACDVARVASGSSPVAVVAGITAALVIAAIKLIVGGISGSVAMISDGVQSIVSAIKSSLLLVGQRLAERPGGERHPHGRGEELFFWALISAALMFAVSGGVPVAQGVARALAPESLNTSALSYAVLAAVALFNAVVWVLAWRKLAAQRAGRSFWRTLWRTRDIANFVIFLDCAGGMLGVLFALVGVLLTDLYDQPLFDAGASIAIGLLWMTVAAAIGDRCRHLLIGEARAWSGR